MSSMSWIASGALLCLAACSSVEVPVERFYRLQLCEAVAPDPARAGTLRVHDLQLGTALDSDCLLCQSGVRLEPRPWSRWVAPLDRLVTDAMVLGLSRARVCDLVKGSADSGSQTWSLHGRIVDFVEVLESAPPGSPENTISTARVTLELWLEAGDELLFHDEFTTTQPLHEAGPDAAVAALSHGLNQVVDRVVGHMRQLDLFAQAGRDKQAKNLAQPPR